MVSVGVYTVLGLRISRVFPSQTSSGLGAATVQSVKIKKKQNKTKSVYPFNPHGSQFDTFDNTDLFKPSGQHEPLCSFHFSFQFIFLSDVHCLPTEACACFPLQEMIEELVSIII